MTVQVSVTAEQYGRPAPPVGFTGAAGVDLAVVFGEYGVSSSSSSQTVGMALTEVQTLVELEEVTV